MSQSVTGANTRIGMAIAERFLADCWKLGYATQDDEERHEGPLRSAYSVCGYPE